MIVHFHRIERKPMSSGGTYIGEVLHGNVRAQLRISDDGAHLMFTRKSWKECAEMMNRTARGVVD